MRYASVLAAERSERRINVLMQLMIINPFDNMFFQAIRNRKQPVEEIRRLFDIIQF